MTFTFSLLVSVLRLKFWTCRLDCFFDFLSFLSFFSLSLSGASLFPTLYLKPFICQLEEFFVNKMYFLKCSRGSSKEVIDIFFSQLKMTAVIPKILANPLRVSNLIKGFFFKLLFPLLKLCATNTITSY